MKPELPEGISHLSLGQRLPSSTAAAARPTAVQDLTQASDAFPPGLLMDSGESRHWLFLTAAEAHPVRKCSGRHVCPECLRARDGMFWQMDGGNFQKASLMDAQGSGQQRLPARRRTWGSGGSRSLLPWSVAFGCCQCSTLFFPVFGSFRSSRIPLHLRQPQKRYGLMVLILSHCSHETTPVLPRALRVRLLVRVLLEKGLPRGEPSAENRVAKVQISALSQLSVA